MLNYNFEAVQKLKFEVWDVDPDDKEFLGTAETTLGEIVSHSGRQYIKQLTGIPGKGCGEIIIVTEELSSCKQIVSMQLRGVNLERKSWFWRNDPFIVLSRSNEDGTYSVVTKSEPVSKYLAS